VNSSAFGIVITRFVDGKIQILYADQFERPDFNEMIQKVWALYVKFQIDGSVDRIYVDGANPSFIRSLKLMLGEHEDYEKIIEHLKIRKFKLNLLLFIYLFVLPYSKYIFLWIFQYSITTIFRLRYLQNIL